MSYEDSFTERTILKLKRKYSKDEEVALLIQALKKKEIEVGELKSEAAHFKDLYIKINGKDLIGYNKLSNQHEELKKTVLGLKGQISLLKKQLVKNKTSSIAKQFREVILDGKWVTGTNLKEQLSDMTWEQATTKIANLNTIAALAFHINYYIAGVADAFETGELNIRDKYSFDFTPPSSAKEWNELKSTIWRDAERFAKLVEQMTDEQLNQPFVREEYGNYQRNIHVIIEHSYYHLGQIILIKKMLPS